MFWNAGGLTSDKFTELRKLIISDDVDLYGIIEAGASTDVIHFFQLQGYQTYVLPRARQVASGIIVAAKSSIPVNFKVVKEHTATDTLEGVELEVWKGGTHRRFLVLYNPPRNKPDLAWLELIWGKGCVLYGDLNAPSTLWGYQSTDAVGKIFEEFIASNPVEYVENDSGSPTFLSYAGYTSHPDVILIHPSDTLKATTSLLPPPGGFGHSILLCTISHSEKTPQEDRRPRWNKRKADWRKYALITDQMLSHDAITGNTDKSLKNVYEIIWRCALKTVPRGKMPKYAPFWNDTLDKLKTERDKARRDLISKKTQLNRIALKRKSAEFKREIVSSKRAAYRKYLSDLDFRKDGLMAHKFLSSMKNQKEERNQPFMIGNKTITSGQDIATCFCKHYAKVSNFRPDKRKGRPDTRPSPSCENEKDSKLVNDQIQFSELEIALSGMKKGKSAGPDDVPPEFLLYLGPKAKLVLLQLFRQVWDSYFPSQWRKAEIVPILKKDKKGNSPEDFRPIALTSTLSKLFERILVNRLEMFLERRKGLADQQAGFRKHRNTVEQVAWLSQAIKDGFQRKQSTLAVFVDFKTAFDRVWRDKLLSKLIGKGVGGRLFHNISSFLSQRFIRVRYKNGLSSYKQTKQGLPQGSVLSPLLFAVMIDDITSALESMPGVSTLLYADDLVVWATSSDIKALESYLNAVLCKLRTWCEVNELLVNPDKTQYQLFTLSTKTHEVRLQYNGEDLIPTKSATYLGVKLDTKLNWANHIEKQADQAARRMGLLKRLTGTKWGANQDVLSLAYKAYVRPVLEYGSELTITAAQSALGKLDIVQNQALRLITGGPKSTPIAAMEVQALVEPTRVRREYLALLLYERLKRLEISRWNNYKPPPVRLKTQSNFWHESENLARRHGIEIESRQAFPLALDLQIRARVVSRLELVQPVSKEQSSSVELRAVALETIALWYPDEEWLHVYTDGSAINAGTMAGAGVFSKDFSLSAPAGVFASNFDGEVKAVLMALEVLRARHDPKVVILVDSQAAIVSIASHVQTDSVGVLQCRSLLRDITSRGTAVVLQWIPSHCGLQGNEEADRLAKEGSRMVQPDTPLEYHGAKRYIKGVLKRNLDCEHLHKAEGKQWELLCKPGGLIPPTLPRNCFVANFRLVTGHDFLGKHLCRIGVVPSPTCLLCSQGEVMSGLHLDICPALEDVRRENANKDDCPRRAAIYWAARRRMAEVANAIA